MLMPTLWGLQKAVSSTNLAMLTRSYAKAKADLATKKNTVAELESQVRQLEKQIEALTPKQKTTNGRGKDALYQNMNAVLEVADPTRLVGLMRVTEKLEKLKAELLEANELCLDAEIKADEIGDKMDAARFSKSEPIAPKLKNWTLGWVGGFLVACLLCSHRPELAEVVQHWVAQVHTAIETGVI
jgi:predicted  nucleic acid-binding Zn-ribbon protein